MCFLAITWAFCLQTCQSTKQLILSNTITSSDKGKGEMASTLTETMWILFSEFCPYKINHETVRMLVVGLAGRHQISAETEKKPQCADLNVCKTKIQCVSNRLFTSDELETDWQLEVILQKIFEVLLYSQVELYLETLYLETCSGRNFKIYKQPLINGYRIRKRQKVWYLLHAVVEGIPDAQEMPSLYNTMGLGLEGSIMAVALGLTLSSEL